jgi:hypothetical protein
MARIFVSCGIVSILSADTKTEEECVELLDDNSKIISVPITYVLI